MKLRKILSLILAVSSLLLVCGCSAKSGKFLYNNDKITINGEMYSYFFNSFYRDFVAENSGLVTAQGLDTSKSLKSQDYSSEKTWYDYISSLVDEEIMPVITLATGAMDEGIALSEENSKRIQETADKYAAEAGKENLTADEYIAKAFGEGVTEKTVRQCLEIKYLAEQYKELLTDTIEVSEEDCERFFNDNPSEMLCCDYLKMTVSKEYTQRLMSSYDKESFINNVRDIITEKNFGGNYEKFKDLIEPMVDMCIYMGMRCDEGSPVMIWATKEGRKPYSIYSGEQSSGEVTVAMVLPAPEGAESEDGIRYRDNVPLKSIRYISYSDDGDTEAKDVFREYENKMTAEDFDALYKANPDKAGKLENIDRAGCPSAMRTWLFREERKPGDTGCFRLFENETSIVCVGEEGDAAWLRSAKEKAFSMNYESKLDGIKLRFPIEKNEERVRAVDDVPFES